ncbi:hypothetical protein [Bartonella sp. A05]|uniref:hypothetical protein n=1 Tax=Bartonella sp. A05 TaxID=2967261 RepID=UPI0022A99B57|nr:hypothetical protein [Bartonella sp. A05]MCZ2204419.1 hypothetical protein [Bartonella sp. A05]
MSRYNPKVFTDVDSLGKLDTKLLIQLFKGFPSFFKAHDINLENGGLNFEEITKAFMQPNEKIQDLDETNELMEALQLITEMSSQNAMDSLLLAANKQGIKLKDQPNSSPADIALYCFLNHEDLFHIQYARSLVKNYRGFNFYWGAHGQKRTFPEVTDDTITALQSELDDWFAENNRLRNCRVYMFPRGHRVSIVIKYGKPLKRELKMKDGETESIFYNPQCHDLLIYNCNSDDISVRTDGKKGQLPKYLYCIGKHIFGNEAYFNEMKIFSLDKLREIQSPAHNFVSVNGIETVTLVEVQYDWDGETEIRKSGNLLSTLIRKNGSKSTPKAKISYAKFSILFEGSNQPRKIGIHSGNQATFGRDEDSLIIEDWINEQQLVAPRIPTQKI